MRSVKFFTLGCKVNQYDTQEMRERFLEAGFKEAAGGAAADIYIINTCTVTRKADKDSLYYIHRSRRENPKAKIIVTGCLAELDHAVIKAQPGVSRIVRNRDKAGIVTFLKRTSRSQKSGISDFQGHTRAFVKVQDGCNNFCSYCKVPYVRGRSRSRRLCSVVSEVKRLVANGYKEIVLTGICLGAYGRDLSPRRALVDLIKDLEKISGLSRIRLSSIEAGDVSDALIRRMAESKKLLPHLHIPIQSGDDGILKKMNRSYSRSGYLALIRRIRKAIPDIAITTDVLVGFPGETQEQFQNTVDLVKKIKPLRAHIFPFSLRPGTAAAGFGCTVRPEVIRKRTALLGKVCHDSTKRYLKQFLGRQAEVLFEQERKGQAGLWEGYTRHYLRVVKKSKDDLQNRLIVVKVGQIAGEDLLEKN